MCTCHLIHQRMTHHVHHRVHYLPTCGVGGGGGGEWTFPYYTQGLLVEPQWPHTAAVPEPSITLLIIIGLMFIWLWRRHDRV